MFRFFNCIVIEVVHLIPVSFRKLNLQDACAASRVEEVVHFKACYISFTSLSDSLFCSGFPNGDLGYCGRGPRHGYSE